MSKSQKGFGRAGLSALATSTLVIGACAALAAPANAALAPSGGQIGIVDTNTQTTQADGATLVYPGQSNQSVADVQLVIPNQFRNGDHIDLALYDRSAGTTDGQANADAAHKLGFSAVPTVKVDPQAYTSYTAGPDGQYGTADDVAATACPPAGTAGALGSDTGQTQNNPAKSTTAGTTPQFTTTLVSSSRANGQAQDIVRLTFNNQSSGNAADNFVVNLSGLKVDTGSDATPGEIRVVPFAFDGTPNSPASLPTTTFGGNTTDSQPLVPGDQSVINEYTVPGYIAPATFSVASPNTLQADGFAQKIGDITIAETNNFSLQAGTYTVDLGPNVTIENTNGANTANPITVKLVNPATGESVSPTATVSGHGFSFDLTQTDPTAANSGKMSVVISGLDLSTQTPGPFTYTLSGGSIDDNGDHSFLVQADTSQEIPAGYAYTAATKTQGVESDDAFYQGSNACVSQDIVAPGFTQSAQAVSANNRIGGQDRYGTAAKIAQTLGNAHDIVLASGENFPDALSANYLAGNDNTGILLTRQGSIPAVTLDALRTLGVDHVFIVGGPNAVSNAVQTQLENTRSYDFAGNISQDKLQVTRLGGVDRYATSRIISEYAAASGLDSQTVGSTNFTYGTASKRTAIVATGEDFPDALAAGAPSAARDLPLVLTRANSLSADAQKTLSDLGIEQVVIAGGTTAVSPAVEAQITAMGIAVKRVGGDNRYGTAAAMADLDILPLNATPTTGGGFGFDDNANGDDQEAILATGEKFADALAGGPYAGAVKDPMLLTRTAALSPETDTWLTDHASSYAEVQALGLTQAVSDAALTKANQDVSK